MKLHNYLFTIVFVGFIGLCYVCIQIEAVKTGYMLQRHEQKISDLLEYKKHIEYSVACSKTPSVLLCKLSDGDRGKSLSFSRNNRIINKYSLPADSKIKLASVSSQRQKQENRIFGFLFATPTVEAQTLDKNSK